MKFSITLLIMVFSMTSFAQKELLDGLFDKEALVFTPTINTTPREGTAMLSYYFTHSKASSIEASIWIKDLGTNLSSDSKKRLIRGLKPVGNRQLDSLLMDGLRAGHFYAIGLDYRYPNSLSRKFTTKVIREAYLYEGSQPAEFNVVRKGINEQAALKKPKPSPSIPCISPDLFVKIDPAGYCGPQNRPAVLIQCDNCHGKSWEFSVEARTAVGQWQPLRADGMAHNALGASVRTEPLCVLPPDTYYLRVLAWGENCKTPVVNTIGTSITIGERGAQPAGAFTEPPSPPSFQGHGPAAVLIPESCRVMAKATLDGTYINGSVEMPLGSECADWRSHIMLSYIHPAHRNIDLEAIPLHAGIEMPFSIELDQQDLYRGIHTLKATVYISQQGAPRPFPTETFWIRAEEAQGTSSFINPDRPVYPPNQDISTRDGSNVVSEYEVLPKDDPAFQGTITRTGVEWEDDFSIDENLYNDNTDALQVTATDPNCTQIFDLQLVASPTQPDKPLYISWLNPRCCQEQGCEYSVWAGRSPQEVSLLVKGSKAGAKVSELLAGVDESTQYFEIVVRTPNGSRKAAYVRGQGPIYGIEAVLAYRDRFQPQKSDALIGVRETQTPKSGAGGGLADRLGDVQSVSYETGDKAGLYEIPKLPISNFRPCKYARKTILEAEEPIYEGDDILISYDFSEPGHQYTLYHQPVGNNEWFVASGTEELQEDSEFDLEVQSYHSGKYLMLVYKPSKNWGCLSAPIDKTIEINVIR